MILSGEMETSLDLEWPDTERGKGTHLRQTLSSGRAAKQMVVLDMRKAQVGRVGRS